MKKNVMMRLASFLLVAVLISTSAISGTYAKYVTSDTATDSARVAKWGIDVQAGGNLFGKYYEAHTDNGGDVITASAAYSADTSDNSNIVAPGTKNTEGFTVAITGTPEVAYTISASATNVQDIFLGVGDWGVMVKATGLNAATDITKYYTVENGVYSLATGAYVAGKDYYELHDAVTVSEAYYPIDWTVVNTGKATAIDTTKNLNTIATSMASGLSIASANANADSAASYKLTWEWDFDGNDQADTILGNLQASTNVVYRADANASYSSNIASTLYNLNVAMTYEVSVTQLN